MFPRLTSLLLTLLYTIPSALTAPPPLPPPYDSTAATTRLLNRRNPSTNSSTPPTITTTIHSANGTDLSPHFRTLVYHQPHPPFTVSPAAATSNLTHHHHPHPRRQTPPSPRRISDCTHPTAHFLGSTCAHSHGSGSLTSLQDYSIRCRDDHPAPPHDLVAAGYDLSGMPMDQPRYFREWGSCNGGEMCMDSLPGRRKRKGVGRGGGWLVEQEQGGEEVEVPVAMCVDWENFVEDPDFLDGVYGVGGAGMGGKGKGEEGGEKKKKKQKLEDKGVAARKTGIVVSGVDGTIPMELARLEVDISGGKGSAVQQQTCRECFGMRTQTAAMDADFVEIEATLLGAAATAGLVWVTVFAG